MKIKIGQTPAAKGMCPKRPPLEGLWRDGQLIANPMAWCSYKKGHKGPHSWEKS